MKTISDSDFALLADKLPMVLSALRCSPYDNAVINAARRLKLFHRKISRQTKKNV